MNPFELHASRTRREPSLFYRQPKLSPGQVVGHWTLLNYVPGTWEGKTQLQAPKWRCACSCGAERLVISRNLNQGVSTCCGHTRPGKFNERKKPQ